MLSWRALMPYAPILTQAPAFVPNCGPGGRTTAQLTLQAVDRTFPLLTRFLETTACPPITPIQASEFDPSRHEAAAELKVLFDRYGSDKATSHQYHLVYGPILADTTTIKAVLEVGMGSKRRDIVSHMGVRGKPGGSLRAFRDYLPNAQIFGADLDHHILFTEERIETFWVDQTTPESVEALPVPELDLIVDDGLHAPNANIAVLTLAMRKLRPGGWVVIEDISAAAVPIWQVIASMMPAGWSVRLVDGGDGFLFCAQKP